MLHTKKYLVGYIDLLAGKSLILNDKEDKELNVVYQCYCEMKSTVDRLSSFAPIPYTIKIFSDNIVVAILSDETMLNDNNPIVALNRMVTIVGYFQRLLLQHNILTRGSITYGDLYIDDLMVWGAALLDAYNLENNIAKFPRVVISENVVKIVSSITDVPEELLFINNIIKDSDGLLFLNYLNFPKDKGVSKLINDSFEKTNSLVEENTDPRILEKLNWHRDYLLSLIENIK